MKSSLFISIVLLSSLLSGCVAEEEMIQEDSSNEVPERISFSAPLLNGSSNMSNFVLEDYVSDGPVLMLWVAAGCMGCHSWTDLLSNEVENGNISESSLLSIHRYPSFESEAYVNEVYGSDENSTNPVSWPLVLPTEDTVVYDIETGSESDSSFYNSFGNPSTPTLQIMNTEGEIVWTSRTYWPTSGVLEEIKVLIN
tara:strand:- start:6534 stop:7124 length:591 start_codon:yes stop_codon:yes gene_type:complete